METKSRYTKREFRALMKSYGYTEIKDVLNILPKQFCWLGSDGWYVLIDSKLIAWAESDWDDKVGMGRYGWCKTYDDVAEQVGTYYGEGFYHELKKILEEQKNESE